MDNNIRINALRAMTQDEQYHELVCYGKIKADYENYDYNGNAIRILAFDYYGTKWWMYLTNGDIIDLKEI